MNKVYEALLRAEMDRIAEQNRSSRESASEATPAESAVSGNAAQLQAGEPQPGQAVLPGTADVESKDALHARKVQWKPEVNRLPALEGRGVLVEQIRVLRSRLHELRLDRPLKTVIVTSGLPGEGKSFIASNLAVGLARSRNQRVLLIDADMRRGKLHSTFGASKEPGLTDYLAGDSTLEEVAQQMTRAESDAVKGFTSLTFIPSGADTDNAADLSGNGRFEALLRAAYDEFDWIIVDSSPVTLVSDGVNLARACDGVILVTRAGETQYEVAQRAQQELKAAKVVGVVLNAVEGVAKVGGYYGYDG